MVKHRLSIIRRGTRLVDTKNPDHQKSAKCIYVYFFLTEKNFFYICTYTYYISWDQTKNFFFIRRLRYESAARVYFFRPEWSAAPLIFFFFYEIFVIIIFFTSRSSGISPRSRCGLPNFECIMRCYVSRKKVIFLGIV